MRRSKHRNIPLIDSEILFAWSHIFFNGTTRTFAKKTYTHVVSLLLQVCSIYTIN